MARPISFHKVWLLKIASKTKKEQINKPQMISLLQMCLSNLQSTKVSRVTLTLLLWLMTSKILRICFSDLEAKRVMDVKQWSSIHWWAPCINLGHHQDTTQCSLYPRIKDNKTTQSLTTPSIIWTTSSPTTTASKAAATKRLLAGAPSPRFWAPFPSAQFTITRSFQIH